MLAALPLAIAGTVFIGGTPPGESREKPGAGFGISQAKAAYPPSAEGQKVAVATDHSDATRAALEVMKGGGNAIDGAIAAVLTLGVVSPVASGIGGGGFAVVYSAKDRKVIALDFRESAPANIDIEALSARDFTKEDVARRGVAVGVPGEPAGLEWLAQHYGKLPLAADAAPAIAYAENGFYFGRNMAQWSGIMRERLQTSPELAATFLPGGSPIGYGTLVKRPELARTLARFGREGARPFYSGDIAAKMVSAAKAFGGTLEAADFAAYKAKEREPLSRTIDGRTIYTMPAPSAGGLMLLETLSMYGASSSSPLAAMGFESSAYLHSVAEAMRGAVADRARFASDPDAEPATTAAYEQALAPQQMAARRARIEPNRTHRSPEFLTREKGTSHVIVADAEGNVVSLTTTVNAPFGARIVAGDTGIILNDELDDFTRASDLAGFGVVGLGPNRPRPGARPVSSMSPTIVLENGAPILAVGGSGGERIATSVTQATIARLVFGLDPSACVSAPRVHVSTSPDLVFESDIPEDVRAGLKARGEVLKESKFGNPAVQMIAFEPMGSFTRVLAASDPRKLGFAAAQ